MMSRSSHVITKAIRANIIIFTHTHAHIHTHAHTHMHTHMHAHTHMHTHMHTHAHTCTHTHTHTHTHDVCVCVCIHLQCCMRNITLVCIQTVFYACVCCLLYYQHTQHHDLHTVIHTLPVVLTQCACVNHKWDIVLLHITLLKHDHSQKDVQGAEFLLTWIV